MLVPPLWQSLFQVYSFLQVQPVATPAADGLYHLIYSRRYFNDVIFPIGLSVAVSAGLDTVHTDWMALFLSRCKKSWRWRRKSVRVSISDRDFCNLLAKFMGGCKKTPAQDNFYKK